MVEGLLRQEVHSFPKSLKYENGFLAYFMMDRALILICMDETTTTPVDITRHINHQHTAHEDGEVHWKCQKIVAWQDESDASAHDTSARRTSVPRLQARHR